MKRAKQRSGKNKKRIKEARREKKKIDILMWDIKKLIAKEKIQFTLNLIGKIGIKL